MAKSRRRRGPSSATARDGQGSSSGGGHGKPSGGGHGKPSSGSGRHEAIAAAAAQQAHDQIEMAQEYDSKPDR
ncbi:unnamed protein product [Miscanthus lutarioriparius]|uniref:Uncharacterized protein n=1 Tax=Miscanthus lutarioriparius TaxID=422564 RepID=A0A811N596_9POAL|nr:unnamed protein product [Miscanthus lutarioriparius]CAD6216647.1 unnamed protein product [Miscanthus lutarioriparius]